MRWIWLAVLLLPAAGLAVEDSQIQVLILTNDSALVGKIEAREGYYEVRTSSGFSQIPASRVRKHCRSLLEAYEDMSQRVNRKDPLDQLRIARWCARYGLEEQARAEAERVLAIQPRNLEALRLAGKGMEASSSSPETRPVSRNEAPSLQPVEHNYTPETLRSFVQRVQPLLFNSCATGACHGSGRGLAFELQKPPSSGLLQPALTRHNLAQTLRLVDRDDPSNSELLRKALEAHGGKNKPPLAGKDVPAYQTLEAWVLSTSPARSNQPLSGEIVTVGGRASPNAVGPALEEPTERPKLPSALEDKFATLPSSEPKTTSGTESERKPGEPAPGPQPLPAAGPVAPARAPSDPFDPAAFNEVYHPRKK